MIRQNKTKYQKIRLPKQQLQLPYTKEIKGALLAVTVLVLFVATYSYSPQDNTLFHYNSTSTETLNKIGSVGAHCATILLFLFGSATYALLVSLFLWSLHFFRTTNTKQQHANHLLGILCITSASAITLQPVNGGLLGSTLATYLVPLCGHTGTLILSLIIGLIGIMLLVHLPIVSFLLRISTACWSCIPLLFRVISASVAVIMKEIGNTIQGFGRLIQISQPKNQPDEIETKPVHPPETKVSSRSSKTTKKIFVLPDETLFNTVEQKVNVTEQKQEAEQHARKLEAKLEHFGIRGEIMEIKPGPLITMFEYQPDATNKLSKITALEDDLAMALQAVSIRIIAPIPGKNAVGFEIANNARHDVFFGALIRDRAFKRYTGMLPIILGVDVAGKPVIEDLITMPHLLVGGTTGSGKSVGMNVMLVSLLCACTPEQLRLILIDPKRLEFTPYADIPHLLFPIVTNPLQAPGVLKWLVQEMEKRYELMAQAGVRNIKEYQKLVQNGACHEDGLPWETMPYIVVLIDELADLMIVAGKDVETHIVRLAQMARAAGIHLIVATQRPSVDVVTGLIKVNFPSRIAFRVSSKIDARTILDQQGAEKLLGRGDMLYMHSSSSHMQRVHGAYITDQEIERLTAHVRSQATPAYKDLDAAIRAAEKHDKHTVKTDELYQEVLEWLDTMDEISISMLQRRFRIGFNRSARIIEQLELDGLLAPAQGSKPRRILRS